MGGGDEELKRKEDGGDEIWEGEMGHRQWVIKKWGGTRQKEAGGQHTKRKVKVRHPVLSPVREGAHMA